MTTSAHTTDIASLPARLSIAQAAAFFGLSQKTIRRAISDGRLKAYRVGPRIIRIERDSLLKMARPVGSVL